MGDGEFITKGPQTCTLSKEQAVSSIMLWLHRAISLVTHARELLPQKCFERIRPDIDISDLLRTGFQESETRLTSSAEPSFPLIVRGRSSRADLLLNTLETTILPAVRSQTIIRFHLLIVQLTVGKRNDILEDYAFTMCHQGQSFLELGLKAVSKSKKKIVIGDVMNNLKQSLTVLDQTLHSLGALPDVRHMLIRMSCPRHTDPSPFEGFVPIGAEEMQMAIRPGWTREQNVQDTIRFGRKDYKGVGLKLDCLRREPSLHEVVQESEVELVHEEVISAIHTQGQRATTTLHSLHDAQPVDESINSGLTQGYDLRASSNVRASASIPCALTQNSTLSATDILRVRDLRQIGEIMQQATHEDGPGDTQTQPGNAGVLEMIDRSPIALRQDSPASNGSSRSGNRNRRSSKRQGSYLCQGMGSQDSVSGSAEGSKQRCLGPRQSGTPEFANYEMNAIVNVSKDWQTPQFGLTH